MSVGIHVGNSRESIEACGDILLEILKLPIGDKIKLKAIDAVKASLNVGPVNLSSCNINMGYNDNNRVE